MKAYRLDCELTNMEYSNLLSEIIGISTYFAFVIFEGDKTTLNDYDKAINFMSQIEKDLVSDEIVAKWPGTETLEKSTRYIKYRLTLENIPLLTSFRSNFDEWRYPYCFDDISFYNEIGEVIFYSTTHEDEFWYFGTDTNVLEIGKWKDLSYIWSMGS